MVIICDSGSTKADWRIIETLATPVDIHTMGFNPVFHNEELIITELNKAFGNKVNPVEVKEVFFYGAGCWDFSLKQIVNRALKTVFPYAITEVEHDLLAAARATCFNEPGIACILGTGSNSCSYDGKNVVDNITNLGYLVGDEGSGSFLGKALIRAYFYREMPRDLLEIFETEYPGKKDEILNGIYQNSAPNVYLASFAKFMSDNKKHFFIEKLVYEGFCEFVDRNVRKYARHLHVPIHFIGSVAYHFSDLLSIVLEERRLIKGIIIKKPIDNLTKFHLNHFESKKY